MAENRDEMLAFFQACTGIENTADALEQLQRNQWDVQRAIDEVIPENSANRASNSPDVEMIQEINRSEKIFETHTVDDSGDDDSIMVVDSSSERQNNWFGQLSKPSTSNNHNGIIKILLKCGETESFTIDALSESTVFELKKEINARTNIPICRQAITGWPGSCPKDSDKLGKLNRSDLILNVRNTTAEGSVNDDSINMTRTYALKIKINSKDQPITLNYQGSKTIRELKMDVFNMSEIPARHQEWVGWPVPITDDETLVGQLGLDSSEHCLTVSARNSPNDAHDSKKPKRLSQNDDSDDSSFGEYEDPPETYGEDMFPSSRGTSKFLMPPKTEDETVGCLQFAEEFANRYGPIHPEFFPGSLCNAIKEACMKPAKERRLLALYLHQDKSILSQVFCTEHLCRESVVQHLATYFILWGWDLTCPFNKNTFFKSFEKELGAIAAVQIREIPDDRLPAIIIINRVRSGLEIISVIQGDMAMNDLMASLTEIVDVFLEQQKVEVAEEDQRSVREMIKMQQDVAFRESLEMDRAKEEARRNQEVASNQEKQREREQREEAAAIKEAQRLSVVSRLPEEPPETEGAIMKIRVRLPKGEFLERRFRETDTLQTLLDWLHVQGYHSAEYKLLSSWPRRDLTAADAQVSLKGHSLCSQETVIVEER